MDGGEGTLRWVAYYEAAVACDAEIYLHTRRMCEAAVTLATPPMSKPIIVSPGWRYSILTGGCIPTVGDM